MVREGKELDLSLCAFNYKRLTGPQPPETRGEAGASGPAAIPLAAQYQPKHPPETHGGVRWGWKIGVNAGITCVSISGTDTCQSPGWTQQVGYLRSEAIILLWAAAGANFSASPGTWFNKSSGWWWTDLRSDRGGDYRHWNTQADGVQTPSAPTNWTTLYSRLQNRTWRSPAAVNSWRKRNMPNGDTHLCLLSSTRRGTESLLASCFIPSQPDCKLAVYINRWKPLPRNQTRGT